ncbi:YceK/YidQ family lipoprotein [Simiduia litorea]|uniref:YceK/YidQ family lipoprotein n=1 Tax=Simiduia litorea TaxID=1435348 RepID=UPI0036F3BC74
MKTIAYILFISLFCVSCGTVKTLNPENDQIDISHRGSKSYCEEIPRVYSGASYFICLLNSEPSETENLGAKFNGVPFVVIDGVFSVAADTVVLPYTVVKQINNGNITVN